MRVLLRYFVALSLTFILLPIVGRAVSGEGNRLKLGSESKIIEFKIVAPQEFDGKKKSEILDMRTKRVQEHAELLENPYQPSPAIFDQIVDHKPWWGMLGTYFHGNGPKSSDGESEESRFILNPFLLIGIAEGTAFYRANPRELVPNPPTPMGLTWKLGPKPTAYMEYAVRYYFEKTSNHLRLVTYNAQDFGFTYLHIDPAHTQNVDWNGARSVPVPLKQLIHVGNSCGKNGGCNNDSPMQQEMNLHIKKLPAFIHIKLWKEIPKDVHQTEDMAFIITLL